MKIEYTNRDIMGVAKGERQSCKNGQATLPCLVTPCGQTIDTTSSSEGVPEVEREAKEGKSPLRLHGTHEGNLIPAAWRVNKVDRGKIGYGTPLL